MTNIAGDKMLGHIDRVVGEHKPITADIFLTNYCNNKCPYCTYGRWELDAGAYSMRFEDFIVYAEKLLKLGVQGFILTGGGEPTICKDFGKITEWLEYRGIHYGINTNFNVQQNIKPDYLKVSLDGWSEDSYERKRGVRNYRKVRENIIRYAAWKEINSPNTSLGVQLLVEMPEDVERFYEANKDLPVDYMVFRPVESTGGIFYNDDLFSSYFAAINYKIKEVMEQDSRAVRNFKWDLLDEQESSCKAQWAQIALNERGEVMYCCHKPYQIVGHIMDEDILEKKEKAGTDMSRCDIPCRMTAPNKFVAEIERKRKDVFFI
ncbi:MAG: radical SAM protein [Eubacteriales bacterium]|nr:radical SAM protein [Eubacteriales bacterium]